MPAETEHLMKAVAQIKSANDAVKLVDANKAIRSKIRCISTKKPTEAKYDWYNFHFVSTVKREDAFRPLDRWGSPFVKT
jgi:hypothetical protein